MMKCRSSQKKRGESATLEKRASNGLYARIVDRSLLRNVKSSKCEKKINNNKKRERAPGRTTMAR